MAELRGHISSREKLNSSETDMLNMRRFTAALVLTLSFLCPVDAAPRGVWTSSGPEGGTITALAVDPQASTTLYVGTRVGGAYKSVDGGESWQAINDGLADVRIRRGNPTAPTAPVIDNDALGHLHVTALTIDPHAPTTLYAATLAGNVFKSTNGGRSWSALDLGKTLRFIRSVVIDPRTPGIIYVSGAPVDWNPMIHGSLATFMAGGVLKSTDGGRHWNAVNNGLLQSTFAGPKPDLGRPVLAIDPLTPATLYAATRAGVFKTTDAGATWSSVNSGLTGFEPRVLAIDSRTPTNLYVGGLMGDPDRSHSARPLRIFKSVDGGHTWTVLEAHGLAAYDLQALVVDPHHPTTIFAASGEPPLGTHSPERFVSGGLFKSTDGGRTWRSVDRGMSNTAVHAVALDPRDPERLYAGTSLAGVFKSSDGGSTWKPINRGFKGLDLYPRTVTVDPKTPTTVYAATNGGGVFKSIDGGGSWQPTNSGLTNTDVTVLAIDPTTPSILHAGTAGGGIFKTMDGGRTWRPANAGLANVESFTVNALVLNPRTPSTVYMSWVGMPYGVPSDVHKSIDGGKTWVSVGGRLPPDRIVLNLAIVPRPRHILFAVLVHAGVWDAGLIFRTSDGGSTWTSTAQDSNLGWDALAIDPSDPAVMFASGRPDREGNGILKSTDGGRIWRQVNRGLTNLHVTAIAIDPRTPTTIYLGTEEWPNQSHGGVFQSTDGGATWHSMNAGLTHLTINALAIDPTTSSTIYAATEDGVFVIRR